MKAKVLLCLCLILLCAQLIRAQDKQYVIFLHNKFLEGHILTEKHPQFGLVEYDQILNQLKNDHTIVIAEIRPKNTDPKVYARKVMAQIDSLKAQKILSKDITIVGTSQGGYIAQYVSDYYKDQDLKYVIVGASFKNDSLELLPNFRLHGRVLSITEKSDSGYKLLSKQQRYKRSRLQEFKEVNLNTGLKHGFLFKALDEWLVPTKEWIQKNSTSF